MPTVNGQAGQIYSLLPKIMAEVGAIEKKRRNSQQGYAFRGIDDVYAALQPVLAANGVVAVPELLEHESHERQTQKGGVLIYSVVKVAYIFFAADGSNIRAVVIGEAMDSGDKASNKAMSAAMKYAMLQTFCIPTEEHKDSEYDSFEPTPAKSPAPEPSDADKFLAMLSEAFEARKFSPEAEAWVIAATCKKYKLQRIADLPPAKRQEMLQMIGNGELDNFNQKGAA